MGILPIWGLQLIIAIALAIYWKLNKGLVLLAANISIPPLIPFILFLSHYVGGFWLGERAAVLSFEKGFTLEFFQDSFLQYALGAVTLAIGAGLAMGLFSYGVMKVMSTIKRKI